MKKIVKRYIRGNTRVTRFADGGVKLETLTKKQLLATLPKPSEPLFAEPDRFCLGPYRGLEK